MRRRLSLLFAGIPALLLIGGLGGPSSQAKNGVAPAGGLSVVLWIDATVSVTEAMANFIWDEDAPRGGIFKGSKTPASPGDAFGGAVTQGFIQRLGPADRARIGSVAKSLTLNASFTADRNGLRRALLGQRGLRRGFLRRTFRRCFYHGTLTPLCSLLTVFCSLFLTPLLSLRLPLQLSSLLRELRSAVALQEQSDRRA